MTVQLFDKRRKLSERACGVGLPNVTWFAILSIDGMDKLINTQHTNDPLNVTKSTARKMAEIIDNWNHPSGWGGETPNFTRSIIVHFLRNCSGFRTC